MHRISLLGAALALAILAPAAAQQAQTPRPGMLTEDFGGVPGFEVSASYVDWPVGRSTGWHTHFGDETALVVAGELRIETAGVPTRIVRQGDVYHNKMGQVHRTTNISTEPARTWAVFVVEKGKPRNTTAAAPPGYPD